MSKDPAVEIAIATPLQAELVEAIRAAQPTARVHYQPDLLPPARYPNDHAGDPNFHRSAAGEEQFTALLACAGCRAPPPGLASCCVMPSSPPRSYAGW